MPEIELLSVVALLEDISDKDLLRGQVGTVVETVAPRATRPRYDPQTRVRKMRDRAGVLIRR